MPRKKIRLNYNKKILVFIVLLVIFIFGLAILIPKQQEGCKSDSDCVKQQVTCCSCNMGGEERCMAKQEAKEWQDKLARECKEERLCIALYNCKDTICKCSNGECVEVEREER